MDINGYCLGRYKSFRGGIKLYTHCGISTVIVLASLLLHKMFTYGLILGEYTDIHPRRYTSGCSSHYRTTEPTDAIPHSVAERNDDEVTSKSGLVRQHRGAWPSHAPDVGAPVHSILSLYP